MIESYDALNLGRYMKINAVLESERDELDKQVEILAILSDIPADDILLLPVADYSRMAAQSAFLRVPCKPTQIEDGWRLGDLVPTMDFRKINTAQYIDFQTFSKRFPATLPELLSVFLVPDGMAYNDGYDVGEVVARVNDLPLPDALGLAAFFFKRYVESIADSVTSWALDLRRTKDPRKREAITRKIAEVQGLLASAGVGLPM